MNRDWIACLSSAPMSAAIESAAGEAPLPGLPVETDPESGAQVVVLGPDTRPADNIYGEQPCSDSTASDPDSTGNAWTAAIGEDCPTPVGAGPLRLSHVSVSRCGRYWLGDTGAEGVPIVIGSFASGRCERAVFSRTVNTREQWSHTHPYLTADNRWLIFTSTRDGHPQVYGARLAPGWLERL